MPDDTIFDKTRFKEDEVKSRLHETAYLNPNLTIRFEDNEIVIKEENIETKYNYSDILKIVEKDEIIYLNLPAKTVIRLYKSKFVDCTWEKCRAKILENNPNVK